MNKKHGAKKLAMSTKWTQDIFYPMFFLCPQGEHLQCFFGAETFYDNIFHIFTAELCASVTIHDTKISKNIRCLLQKQEICSCNVCAQNWTYFFLKNTEDVLPADTGKTLEKIYLASGRW